MTLRYGLQVGWFADLTPEELAELEANFPHGDLTDDQDDAWLANAVLAFRIATLEDDEP